MRFSSDIQKFFFKTVNDIPYLIENNIKLYFSVPSNASLPYLKVSDMDIAASDNNVIDDERIVNFTIKIITQSKSTKTVSDIADSLYTSLPKVFNGAADETGAITVSNVIDLSFSITEDIENSLWVGLCRVKLLVQKNK